MNSRAATRLDLESSFRRAIENEEFLVHYQPQVDIQSKRIVGAEALVRWQHPKLGLLPPTSSFHWGGIGSILPLGAWTLRQACAQPCRNRSIAISPHLSEPGECLSGVIVFCEGSLVNSNSRLLLRVVSARVLYYSLKQNVSSIVGRRRYGQHAGRESGLLPPSGLSAKPGAKSRHRAGELNRFLRQ